VFDELLERGSAGLQCDTASSRRSKPTAICGPQPDTIRLDNPRATTAWLKGARHCIKNLAQHPERCPLAPETTSFVEPIRELLYGHGNRGTYRILYVVLGKTVFVLHVRHGARQPWEAGQGVKNAAGLNPRVALEDRYAPCVARPELA